MTDNRIADEMVEAALVASGLSGGGGYREAINAALTAAYPLMQTSDLNNAVSVASIKWCGEKDWEAFLDDVTYFEQNWRALRGLRAYVAEEFLAAALTAAGRKALEDS